MTGFKQCSILKFADLQGNGTTQLPVEGHTFHIQHPFIVNHTLIEKDAEVVLKWDQTPETPEKKTRPLSDQLHQREVNMQKNVF